MYFKKLKKIMNYYYINYRNFNMSLKILKECEVTLVIKL